MLIRTSFLLLAVAAALYGQIVIRTDFEGGNIGRVTVVSPTHLRCAVQGQADHDQRNRQANWYYFELSRLPRAAVTIELTELAGEYDYRAPVYAVTAGTRPVYSYDGVRWTHFTDAQVAWDNQEPHLTVTFRPERSRMWIAHVAPYTNSTLAALLAAFQGNPYLDRQVIGRTVGGREIPLLTITNPKIAETAKKVVWLMFRQHAWEAGSSWAGDGAIRFLLSADARAAELRDHVIFKILPIADPDGVAAGTIRYNRNGFDLNRNWDTLDAVKMPEIAAQHRAIVDWVDGGHRVDAFLSLHNTEKGEYLEAPSAFRVVAERFFDWLKASSTFNPTTPIRETPPPGAVGRMTVAQGLFHDRKLPAMLMEQMVEQNSKLGRCPTAADRQEFGAALVRALAFAVRS